MRSGSAAARGAARAGRSVERARRPARYHSAYGLPRGDLALDLARPGRSGRCSRSTRKSFPGCSRPLRTMFSGGSSSTPVSDASTTQPSVGLEPAARAQAVAVERRADHASVGERDRRRAVPRLHQALVVGVEARAARSSMSSRPCVRLRDHHHHRVRQRPARRARAARARCRTSPSPSRRGARPAAPSARSSPKSSDASCDSRARIQLTLPRSVLISPLWAIIAVRVRELPAREGVRRVARVHERERRLACARRCRSG